MVAIVSGASLDSLHTWLMAAYLKAILARPNTSADDWLGLRAVLSVSVKVCGCRDPMMVTQRTPEGRRPRHER